MKVMTNEAQMSRRDVGGMSVAALATLAGWQGAPALAQAVQQTQAAQPASAMQAPEEGLDYVKLDTAAPTTNPIGKIEVVEFFWYHCPHCFRFEPTLHAWLKKLPKDVHFRRVHVAFRKEFELDQKLFYALEAMGLLDKLHAQVFTAAHVDKIDFSTRERIVEWVVKQGIDKNKFESNFDSFATGSKATKATQLQVAYGVRGVPSIGIAGKFYTDGSLAQGMERALQITDYLIAAERKNPAKVGKAKPSKAAN